MSNWLRTNSEEQRHLNQWCSIQGSPLRGKNKYYWIQIKRLVITDGYIFTKFTHLFIQLLIINRIFTEYLRCTKHYTILCYENKAD